jgi:hypothetical protein
MLVGLVVIDGGFDVEEGFFLMFEVVQVQFKSLVDFLT